MKRILSVFLCLIFIYCIVSCDENVPYSEPEITESTSQEVPADEQLPTDEQLPYTFISRQELLTWKDKIVTIISDNGLYDDYEVLQHNFSGMALMDLNFDNTPELIAAYAGGAMGNVCLVAFDLESGEQLCVWGDTPHYQESNNVYFCVYRNNDGSYVLVNEGALRGGYEWYLFTLILTEDFYLDSIFKETISEGESNRYYCNENEVNKTEFERQKAQFENDYKAITETQLKITYWETIEAKKKSEAISEMADKLVNSEQQFIRFDISTPTVNMNAQQTTPDYKKAYIDFLKDKQESHDLFSLVFIDNDDIPELYLSGVSQAEGDMICSYKNNTVVYQYLSRTGGGKYIQRSGDIINQNGHMGFYYDNVYKLNNDGFSQTLNASYTERYEDLGNEEYRMIREYFTDGTTVSEAEYNNAVSSAFDLSRAVRLDENAVSYDEIIRQLQNGYSEGK